MREQWPITTREDLDEGHDHALIVLGVNHDPSADAVGCLSTCVGDATVLVVDNVRSDPVAEALPGSRRRGRCSGKAHRSSAG